MSFLDSDTETAPAQLEQYKRCLEKAHREDLSDFDRQGLVRSLGKNKDNEEVVLVTPCFLSGEADQLERAMHYGLSKLQHCEHTPFVLVFALTYTNWLTDNSSTYLKQCSSYIPASIKRNLKKVYLLHWTVPMKLVLAAMSPMVPAKFWEKVIYLDHLSDILSTLQIPPAEALAKFPYVVQHEEEIRVSPEDALTIFGTPVPVLSERIPLDVVKPYTRLPSVYVDFVTHLTSREVIQTKDLFYLQADCASLYAFVGDIDTGNPAVEWSNVRALVTSFRLLFDSMPVPLLGPKAYSTFVELSKATIKPDKGKLQEALTKLFNSLSIGEQESFSYLLSTFKRIAAESDTNGMTSSKIAEVFGPSFCRPPEKPDSQLPIISQIAVEALALAVENPQWFALSAKEESSDDSSEEEESSEEESESEDSTTEFPAKKPAAATGVLPAAKSTPRVPNSVTARTAPTSAAGILKPTPVVSAKTESPKRRDSSSSSEEEEETSEEEDDEEDEDEENNE